MSAYSKLVSMRIENLGCIGPEGLDVQLDDILCLVGANNAGKTTVLRAYELAVKCEPLADGERSDRCPEQGCPAVEISVHIPEGMANIAEKWKEPQDDLLLVRSRWEWRDKKPTRLTWDPQAKEYSDKKAAGVDTVFGSRLPQPLRVSALGGPLKEHDALLALILSDISEKLNSAVATEETELWNAVSQLRSSVRASIGEFQSDVTTAADQVNKEFRQVFPNLSVDLRIDVPEMPVEMGALLKKGSTIEVVEGSSKTRWDQQGTGSQRALFWSLLGVRSRLSALKNERKAAEKAKSSKSKIASADDAADEVKLPGHMLLIDEPETALHPNAIRAARRYLYELARDEGWQVMLTTHSPLFIDPTEDHTTIVRLERRGEESIPKTFRASRAAFGGDEREQLKLLLQFDSNLAEVFFGGYPLVVEGDTEFAAFNTLMAMNVEEYPLEARPLIVRARGKYTIVPIIKILRQFGIPFSVLHDSDTPSTVKGKANAAWAANSRILEQLIEAAESGIPVGYRVSVPNFEEAHHAPLSSKDKPWSAVEAVRSNPAIAASIKSVLADLLSVQANNHLSSWRDELISQVREWGETQAKDDPRFQFPKVG